MTINPGFPTKLTVESNQDMWERVRVIARFDTATETFTYTGRCLDCRKDHEADTIREARQAAQACCGPMRLRRL